MVLRSPDEASRTTRERDLFRALLRLAQLSDLRAFVEGALATAVKLTGADKGYLALYDPLRDSLEPRWWTAHGWEDADLKRVRESLSSGIMAESLTSGGVVRSNSAITDVRFSANESVRRNGIEAVLCAPIGGGAFKGVVYLQGRPGGGPFSDDDLELLGTLAQTTGGFAERLISESAKGPRAPDPTAVWRERMDLTGIVGRSDALALVFEELAWIAPSGLDVLIRGPSGAGKTLFASAIHRNSPRKAGPFVELNCSALPETLFEVLMFGGVKGTYTDSVSRAGHVATAEKGTLFLDEVGELSPANQAKLLTLLEARTYIPVGGVTTRADVRVIAATNVNLELAVREHRFREDLYFRLKVAHLTLPALAQRREDIAALAHHFVRLSGKVLPISPGAELALELASWPGDVRELHHLMQTAVAKASGRGETWIQRRHLFPDPSASAETGPPTLQDATHTFKRGYILGRLRANGWNVSATARELDVARGYLYTLMQVLGIQPE